MNSYKNITDRIQATKLLIEDEINSNINGYNPIRKKYINKDNEIIGEFHNKLYIIEALNSSKE